MGTHRLFDDASGSILVAYHYIFIESPNPTELADTVTKKHGEGYRCVGGIAMAWVPSERGDSVMVYAQAMEKLR